MIWDNVSSLRNHGGDGRGLRSFDGADGDGDGARASALVRLGDATSLLVDVQDLLRGGGVEGVHLRNSKTRNGSASMFNNKHHPKREGRRLTERPPF